MVRVNIASHGGASFMTAEINDNTTVGDLRDMIYKNKGVSPIRQQLIIEKDHEATVLEDDKAKLVSTYSITNDSFKILFKDKGPQIHPQLVGLLEYAGALLIYLLFLPLDVEPNLSVNNGKTWQMNISQQIGAFLWVTHFVKRIAETLLVHNYGTLTLPALALVKGCIYYWASAAAVGWSVNRPAAGDLESWHVMVGFPVFCMAMFCNLICHVQLKYLRHQGTNNVGLPRGFLFEYVDCPHYLCEIVMWAAFNVVTGFTPAGIAFCVLGAIIMAINAKSKHVAYKKKFRARYPRNRKILIPLVF